MNIRSTKTMPSQIKQWCEDERSDFCPHAISDHALIVAVLCEDDSFGPVERNCVCRECLTSSNACEDADLYLCRDCNEHQPRHCGVLRTSYSFSGTGQSDESIFVCRACLSESKYWDWED